MSFQSSALFAWTSQLPLQPPQHPPQPLPHWPLRSFPSLFRTIKKTTTASTVIIIISAINPSLSQQFRSIMSILCKTLFFVTLYFENHSHFKYTLLRSSCQAV